MHCECDYMVASAISSDGPQQLNGKIPKAVQCCLHRSVGDRWDCRRYWMSEGCVDRIIVHQSLCRRLQSSEFEKLGHQRWHFLILNGNAVIASGGLEHKGNTNESTA